MEFVYLINQNEPVPGPVLVPDIQRKDVDMPELPEKFHVRRGFGVSAENYGPYSAQAVAEYLSSGLLSPDDYYKASNGQWQKLSTTGLG